MPQIKELIYKFHQDPNSHKKDTVNKNSTWQSITLN